MELDFKAQAESLGLEEEEFQELTDLFVETCGLDLKRLSSAIREGNLQEVVEASHSIKGSSGNLGFVDIYDLAEELEAKARNDTLKGAMEAAGELQKQLAQIRTA
ncbi:Hpt domain-containing protein [Thermodesulfobacteriota bacterium]